MSIVKPGAGMNSGSDAVFNAGSSSEDNFFTGGFNHNAQYFDPLVTGHAFIVWTRFPEWVLKEYPNIKSLTQKNFLALDGIVDIELATQGITEGFSANEYHIAQGIAAKPSSFNLKHLEYSGSPIKNAYQHWVTGIRDPRTGIATYPKQYGLDYRAKNHTAELMYIVVRPDANNIEKNIIEFAAYFTSVFPKKIALGHFNYAKSTQNANNEIDMPFAGQLHISPKVDEAAVALLKSGAIGFNFEEEAEYDPSNIQA